MSEARKLLLKPASFQSSKSEQNGNSNENGSASRSVVNNPFLKCEKDEPESAKQDSNDAEKDSTKLTAANNLFQPAKTNLFASAASSSFSGGNSNFVFGQHLAERVVIDQSKPTPSEDTSSSSDRVEETGQLFTNAITSSKPPETDSSKDGDVQIVPESTADEKKNGNEAESAEKSMSLVEAARKYEEMRGAQKRKYEEVETMTGEEDERNIVEINCKLFTFVENNYEERGRGILRLNDSKSGSHSRVVFRASGSLRLLLNTKVWRDQICEQPSQKSLRLTAFDTNGVVKIYLAMGRVDDMNQLFRVLNSRIQRERERTPEPEPVRQEAEKVHETSSVDDSPEESDEPETKRKALTN